MFLKKHKECSNKHMTQFHRDNIESEWQDLVEEFPHIFLEPSEEVIEMYESYKDREFKDFPNSLEQCCNLRYGFECPIEWKDIIREFCQEMDNLMTEARNAGHDFKYCSFILKQKFGSCRDQGTTSGVDADKYHSRRCDISERLYTKSLSIKRNTKQNFKHKN
jgi:hypothetical protein